MLFGNKNTSNHRFGNKTFSTQLFGNKTSKPSSRNDKYVINN